jgi:hypothetical protein
VRDLLTASKRPIQIPVYIADSLFLPSEVREHSLGKAPSYEIRFGGNRRVEIPDELVKAPELFDPAIGACAAVAEDHARKGRESLNSLKAFLVKAAPTIAAHRQFEDMCSALWTFTTELADLIKQHKNSIWSFVVKNAYRPAMMRDRFDHIIGNPPWLSYRYISDPEYQAEVKRRAVEEYRIAPRSQKLMTHMELATVFLVHAMSTFGKQDATLAFVMPRSVLSADQHQNLRMRQYRAPVSVYQYYDLREVSNIFKVPCAVLFARKETPRPATSYRLPAFEWSGKLPTKDLSWRQAESMLEVHKKTAHLIYLGMRSAISSEEGLSRPHKSSPYAKRFKQGATIFPRNCYFVHIPGLIRHPDPAGLYWAETEPEQAKSAKPPYRDVICKGQVEGRFLYSTALSKDVLPFIVTAPTMLVLPIEVASSGLTVGRPVIKSAAGLTKDGDREFGAWMENVEAIWKKKRGKKAKNQSAYERLDYQGGLSSQDLSHPVLVLYNAAGTNISAASVDRRLLPAPFIVESTTYSYPAPSQAAADYLAAVLNSSVVNDSIKPFQSLGLQGERHVHKKVLDLPIPLYSPSNTLHVQLSDLGRTASVAAQALVSNEPLPKTLAQRRAKVRRALAQVIKDIDTATRQLLAPDRAD